MIRESGPSVSKPIMRWATWASSRRRLRAYAVAGVKECWLVLGPEKQIEVHRQPQSEQFAERALHGPGGSLNSTAVPSFTVEMDGLFTA